MTKSSSASKSGKITRKAASDQPPETSKLDALVALLRQQNGATIAELSSATGWQTHSVRGALAGTLKKKGHVISSDILEGVRRYRIAETRA